MFDSVSSVAMKSALDALSLRSRVIADNVANIDTPGFLAGRVSFEDALAKAVAHGTGTAAARIDRSLEPTRTDGNNVNLDAETLLHIDTNLRYEVATRAISEHYGAIRVASRTS